MDRATERLVRERAGGLCEYCHAPQSAYPERFQIDHVIARQHDGPTEPANLALCCLDCNLHKGPNISSRDPIGGAMIRLFDPRTDRWNDHFQWDGPVAVGLTPIGRATVRLLAMNRPNRVVVREALIAEGIFPPPGDGVADPG
jgi:hypothetical protein